MRTPDQSLERAAESQPGFVHCETEGYRWETPAAVPAEVSEAQMRDQFEWPRPAGELAWCEIEGLRFPVLQGRGSGRPVLFVHGLGHDLSDWRHCFSPGIDARALDLPGFGLAEHPDRAYPLSLLSEALARAAELCDRPPVVVASSLGGHVAMLAALEGARFAGLLLAATGGLIRLPRSLRSAALDHYSEDALVSRSDDEVVAGARMLFADADCAASSRLAARKLALHRSTWVRPMMRAFASVVASVVDNPLDRRLREIELPVLHVSGAHDVIVPPAAVQAAANTHGHELVVLDGVGHVPMLEAPERFNEIVDDFVGRVS